MRPVVFPIDDNNLSVFFYSLYHAFNAFIIFIKRVFRRFQFYHLISFWAHWMSGGRPKILIGYPWYGSWATKRSLTSVYRCRQLEEDKNDVTGVEIKRKNQRQRGKGDRRRLLDDGIGRPGNVYTIIITYTLRRTDCKIKKEEKKPSFVLSRCCVCAHLVW